MLEIFHVLQKAPRPKDPRLKLPQEPFWTKAACQVRSARSRSGDKGDEGKEFHQYDIVRF